VAAQDVSFWIDASSTYAEPPAGVTGDAGLYGLYGLRAEATLPWFDLAAAGRFGDALADVDGRWIQGEVSAAGGRRLGAVALRANATGFGLRYVDPFDFDAAGADLRTDLSFRVGGIGVSIAPRLAHGAWATVDREGDLRVVGGHIALDRFVGPVALSATAGAVDVENGLTAGTYTRGAATATLVRGRWTLALSAMTQRTPIETESGARAAIIGAIRPGLRAYLLAGRSLRDPLFGTPGSVTVSAGVSVRPLRWTAPSPPPVAAIGAAANGGRSVRFSIRAPGAARVELAGDFTEWEAVPLERDGDWWAAERVLPPGVHHFSFLVDGEWALPADAPGVVEDGWGRENASIVIAP
jgi:hypothetical protein